MLFFTWRGVLGMFIGGVGAAIALKIIASAGHGLTDGQEFCYGILLVNLLGSLLALTTDRSDMPGLYDSYRASLVQLFSTSKILNPNDKPLPSDIGFDERRRVAFFIYPLVLGPVLVLTVAIFTSIIDLIQGIHFASGGEYALYIFTATIAVAFELLFASMTKPLRLLP